ncbi:MAG: chlorite dismutase family protein [Candidatus Levyibacteriota bacterium]
MVCHNYIFFSAKDGLHELPEKTRKEYEKAFLKLLTSDKKVIPHTFSTLGLKANMNLLIWFQADNIETIQDLLNKLMHSDLGKYLTIAHTLFGMTRPTQYHKDSTMHVETDRKGKKYLIIYPFTKKMEWYKIDFEGRRNLMWGHVQIGKKHPTIEQLLLYSYGIDDSEFLVSYETDDLSEFQTLVMDLRSDKVREYTLKDTPIFTCVYRKPEEALTFL